MKLDAATIQVLKNFSSINQSIMFKAGNVIRTISPSKTIMARAILNQDFPAQFAVYDLSRFLGTISLFENPVLEIHEKHLDIIEGNNKFSYAFTDPSLIVVPPEKEINLASAEVKFRLTGEALHKVMRALGVASLPELAVTGKNGKIYLQAVDTRGTTNDVFSVEVGETSNTFRMIFRAENIKLISGDYDVSISSKGLAYFKGDNIEYWVAVESNSSYE